MAREDIVIAWSFAPVPDAVKATFRRPTRFIAIPTPSGRKYKDQMLSFGQTPVRGILQRYAPGVEPLRVATLGFSESCSGARALLASGDGNRIDAAIAIDGIHAAYTADKQPYEPHIRPWVALGQKAYENEALCVITHSSIKPPTFASTTETADAIWTALTGTPGAAVYPSMPDLSYGSHSVSGISYPSPDLQPPKRLNGLFILGFNNRDPNGTADHIYQAKYVLPVMVGQLLAPRWNDIDPLNPSAGCYIA